MPGSSPNCRSRLVAWAVFLTVGTALGSAAWAQGTPNARYRPLNQRAAPGVAGQWAATIDPKLVGFCQEVKVDFPGGGVVSWYDQGAETPAYATPAQAGLMVGALYRFKIGGMPDFPGTELYPTIELISRLHPPPGKELVYPVPVAFTREEIEAAVAGKMVTKIVYVQQPDLLAVDPDNPELPVLRASLESDALAIADERGRPIAILRLGGRTAPQGGLPSPEFFGAGLPVRLMQPSDSKTTPVAGSRSKSNRVQAAAHEARTSR